MNNESFHADNEPDASDIRINEILDTKESGDASRKAGQKQANTPKRKAPLSQQDIQAIKETLITTAKLGATETISRYQAPGVIVEILASVMAHWPKTKDSFYVRDLMQASFSERSARRIVKRARAMSATITVPAAVQQPATDTALAQVPAPASPAIAGGGVETAGKEKATAGNTAMVATPLAVVDDGPVTRLTDFTPLPLDKYKRGSSLRRHYPEIFDGYEPFDHKRSTLGGNLKGTYFPEVRELQKYEKLWSGVGFQMVPEDLPRILPALRKAGFLDFYAPPADLIAEIETEREKMIAAGVDMDLPRFLSKP